VEPMGSGTAVPRQRSSYRNRDFRRDYSIRLLPYFTHFNVRFMVLIAGGLD
jgi:hypothetical protein